MSEPVIATTRIVAPPEVVFPYFTDPALIVTWLASSAELEARPGGRLALEISGNRLEGSFVTVEPPHRVVFTWGVPGSEPMPAGSTTVEVTLTADGDETVVTLTHRDLPEEERPPHQQGWQHFLGQLPAAVS